MPSPWAILGGLVVAVVTTWLTAQGTRAEAVRQERLSAYADFAAAVGACFHNSLDGDAGRLPVDCFKSLGRVD